MAGHGGGGKSFVALTVAVHVALGLPFGDLATTRTRTLFYSGEDGRRPLQQRLAKICRAMRIDMARLDGWLFMIDASDADPALFRENRIGQGNQSFLAFETAMLGKLAAMVKRIDAGMIVVDNASDAFDDDEIKRARVRAFIRTLRTHIARPGRAVLLLAHISKTSAKASNAGNVGGEDYSGSTAWHNSVRSRLSLTPDGDGAMLISHEKANLGMKADQVRIEWADGVPVVAGGGYANPGKELAEDMRKAAERARDDTDKAALVSIIQDFDRRGERITTSFQGSSTTYLLLRGVAGFPKDTDKERAKRLLRELESDGGIYRRTMKTPDRKMREVFTCLAADTGSAPIPDNEAGGEAGSE